MRKLTDYLGLLILTGGAAVLMLTISAGNDQLGWVFGKDSDAEAAGAIKVPPTPVSAVDVSPESVELLQRYSGRIEPFERHTLAFELSGRLIALGANAEGAPLDDGDDVMAGQPLAFLDNAALVAAVDEAKATVEEMESELSRNQALAAQGDRLITQAEMIRTAKNVERAIARKRIAEKNLADATLYAPGNARDERGTAPRKSYRIERRRANVGESVNVHEPVFELLEVDRLLLVVSVPESKIRDIERGQRVHLELLARDPFGGTIPTVEGEVYREAESADDSTGAFDVEILIDNRANQLKPGMIAVADIVVATIENGFRLPITSMVQRHGKSILFSIDATGRAESVPLDRWIAQGPDLILPDLSSQHRRIVTRGQRRLVNGREVNVVDLPSPDEEATPVAELLIATPNAESPE